LTLRYSLLLFVWVGPSAEHTGGGGCNHSPRDTLPNQESAGTAPSFGRGGASLPPRNALPYQDSAGTAPSGTPPLLGKGGTSLPPRDTLPYQGLTRWNGIGSSSNVRGGGYRYPREIHSPTRAARAQPPAGWPLQDIRLLNQGLRTNQYYVRHWTPPVWHPFVYVAIDIG